MPIQNLQHRRTHNLLLISKILNQRENASPFTLILDSLSQSGKPLIQEYIRRAKISKTQIIYISYETLQPPTDTTTFIKAWSLSPPLLQKEIASHTSPNTKTLLIIDTLHPLIITLPTTLSTFLSSLPAPTTTLLATYHLDIPPPPPPAATPYQLLPLTLLKYLATTLLTTHSLSHILSQKAARDKSQAAPTHGLAEETEGVLIGLGANDARGIVFEMEARRKSGRAIVETFFLPALPLTSDANVKSERIMLLEDFDLYRRKPEEGRVAGGEGEGGMDTTFNLGLTEKQRRDREGVVLPYFDAQKEEGGQGGRILYDLGVEDDFDEEEDEI